MNTLEKILSDLMQIEYDINAFCVILKALKGYYEVKNNEELNAVIWMMEKQMQSFEEKLANNITSLDEYLLKK